MSQQHVIEFDEARHEYRVGGRLVPGVTSILRPLVDFSGIPPAVLEAKADLGRRVHFACELHDDDDLDETSVEPDVAPYLQAYRQWRADTGAVILLNEHKVYHPVLGYAGTLDRVANFGHHEWLIDLKTCFTTPMSAGPQTAAYQAALGVRTQRRAALRLRPDGTYRLDKLDGLNDWAVFMACLTLRNFKESNRD
ncbi:MAG: hypothetical protein HY855_25010 [Burkholderiales bacterium]|nr:hypothetical protein [Burkholderiales bacterium]